MVLRWLFACLIALVADFSVAQAPGSTRPTVGLRQNPPHIAALVGGRVVVQPGVVLEDAVVVLDGSIIMAVGSRTKMVIPGGAEIIDCKGRTIYPGLIDAGGEAEVAEPPRDRGAPHWNGNIMPQRNASQVVGSVGEGNKNLRSQGITVRLIAPRGGIVQGTSCTVLTGEKSGPESLLADRVWQHLQLTVPRGNSRDKYPNSPMGAVALLRQTLYDAAWYRGALAVYANSHDTPRPDANAALEVLSQDVPQLTFAIDAPNERMAIRAAEFAREFALSIVIKGSGREYRALDEIVKHGHPILLPVNFPEPPHVAVEAVERTLTQAELMHWKLAPENPAKLRNAGATICLTTADLKDVDQFLKQVRVAVTRGLKADDALAAMTTVPARLLGLETKCGEIAVGMLANLVVTDGDLFDNETKLLATWVAGERFEIEKPKAPHPQPGRWRFSMPVATGDSIVLNLRIDDKGKAKVSTSYASQIAENEKLLEWEQVVQERFRLLGTLDLSRLDEQWPTGTSRVSLLYTTPTSGQPLVELSLRLPDGTNPQAVGVALGSASPTSDSNQVAETAKSTKPTATKSKLDVVYPLGAYGLRQPIAPRGPVLLRGATVWTSGPAGKLDRADVLIRDGIIAALGVNLPTPKDAEVLNLAGKHMTPGLIDCHSHIATDGGVNESGQAITAEVRIGDFIDCSDISIYRQLASGVTTANILHGSANPIGGQNRVIKLRWGASMEDLVFQSVPAGIKFALGENVKQSNGNSSGRYPGSRMGVEQIIRDQLMAARLYDAEQRRYRAGQREGLPPRVDLQLEALAEVLHGERWIHCHSYRQDEIVAFLDVLEEFNVQVGTLQHVLEGYKVADRLKRHGAMASSFADWWGYKFEVFDAIPYNGALMHRQGVVVSFNSDDAELATHLNTEAAKAIKYGGVSEQDALKFVTLNPALQLRIADQTGSLEVGKDADVAIWSGPPLSAFSRCEQAWIDGRQYFSLEQDAKLQERDSQIRASLIQEILTINDKPKDSGKAKVEEEDRWVRTDVFCGCRNAQVTQGESP